MREARPARARAIWPVKRATRAPQEHPSWSSPGAASRLRGAPPGRRTPASPVRASLRGLLLARGRIGPALAGHRRRLLSIAHPESYVELRRHAPLAGAEGGDAVGRRVRAAGPVGDRSMFGLRSVRLP